MWYASSLGKGASLLLRSTGLCIIGLLFLLFGYSHAQAASIGVGGSCSLVNAITSANTDSSVGSCTPGSGEDTVVLSDTVYNLTQADNAFFGQNDGLPVITSTVTISGNGATIQRDLSLGCPTVLVTKTFHLFAVDSTGDLRLNDVTLQNGCEQSGGAIFIPVAQGKLFLRNSHIMSNTATFSGGGIYAQGDVVTITQSSFISNTAGDNGGGLYLNRGSVENSEFRLNSAGEEGGALLLVGGGDKHLLSNRIFANRAVESGGAIYMLGAAVYLDNNVIAGNVVSDTEEPADIGSGFSPSTLYGQHNTMVAASTGGQTAIAAGLNGTIDRVYITDTILSGYAVGLFTKNTAQITANGLLWDNIITPTQKLLTGAITVTNDLTGSAAYVDPTALDYHLTLASTAINHAVSNVPSTDFDGDLRPQGGVSDLGFDEFVPIAGLEVTKTVGTDADSCATTHLLSVQSSSAVFYCFTLFNSGNVTLTEHSVTDGLLNVQSNLTFDLAPSATVQITRSMISALGPVTITGSVTNTVVVTSSDVVSAPTNLVRAAQFAAQATATDTAVVLASEPTGLPPVEQPEQGDNRLYLPMTHN